jgi:hypothetical protein
MSQPTKKRYTGAYRNLLSESWFGVAPLWKTFWLIGVVGHLLVLVTTEFLLGFVPRSILSQSAMIWSGTGWLAYLFYAAFSSVCIWRCARNASSPVWAALSRVAITLNALFVAFGIALLLATRGS